MTDVATKAKAARATAAASADAFRRAKALHDAEKYAEAEALLREAIAVMSHIDSRWLGEFIAASCEIL